MQHAHEGSLRLIQSRIARYLETGVEHDLEMIDDAICMYVTTARPVEGLLTWNDVEEHTLEYGPANWPAVKRVLDKRK